MEPLHGVLDMLVLRTLIFGPLHGYGVAKAIRSSSTDALEIEFGSLYPALKRLEKRGWIESEWGTSDNGRKAKFYSLTSSGRQALPRLVSEWEAYVSAVDRAVRYGNPRGLWAAPGGQAGGRAGGQ